MIDLSINLSKPLVPASDGVVMGSQGSSNIEVEGKVQSDKPSYREVHGCLERNNVVTTGANLGILG